MTQLSFFIGGQLFLFIPKKRKQKTDMLKLSKYCWRQKGNPNYDNQKDNTPLMLAVKNWHAEVVDILLSAECNPNHKKR